MMVTNVTMSQFKNNKKKLNHAEEKINKNRPIPEKESVDTDTRKKCKCQPIISACRYIGRSLLTGTYPLSMHCLIAEVHRAAVAQVVKEDD